MLKLSEDELVLPGQVGPVLPVHHPTAVIYLDESGVIKTDRFFGIGCLKVVDDPALRRSLHGHRQRLECMNDEIHWSAFNKAPTAQGSLFDLAVAAIDSFFDLDGVSFCCAVADRQNGDLVGSYRSSWAAYEALSVQALNRTVGAEEVVSVVADHVDTPNDVRFEDEVKKELNRSRERLAITTLTRAHSHAMEGLQLADLLLGAAMFDFRRGRDSPSPKSQKSELCDYLLDRCGVPSFRPSGKEVAGKIKVEMRRRRRTRRGGRGRKGKQSDG
jgi:hypothetical protein